MAAWFVVQCTAALACGMQTCAAQHAQHGAQGLCPAAQQNNTPTIIYFYYLSAPCYACRAREHLGMESYLEPADTVRDMAAAMLQHAKQGRGVGGPGMRRRRAPWLVGLGCAVLAMGVGLVFGGRR